MASSQDPTDPLHRERLDELIATYRRRGQFERAAYLERMDEGTHVLARVRSGDRDALTETLAWWTGDDSIARALLVQMIRAELSKRELTRARNDPRSHTPRLQHQISELDRTYEQASKELRALIDQVLVAGLFCRVDRSLRPGGVPTADAFIYEMLMKLRENIYGSALAATQPLPQVDLRPVPDDDAHAARRAYIVVCERCSFVDLRERHARRCPRCQDARERSREALWKPVALPNSRWIVTGETSVTLGHCDVCEGPFAVERASANNPHPACRVAKSRRLAREEWTKDEDDEKVLRALLCDPQLPTTLSRKTQIPKAYVLGALRRLERRGIARSRHPDGTSCIVIKNGRVVMDGDRVAESWILAARSNGRGGR